MSEKILELNNVVFSFKTYAGLVHAVRGVSFEVRKGEILGIVGESGCGKSVTAQSILRLNPEPPGFFEGGEILFKGQDIIKMNNKQLRNIRGKDIGFIFQDPMTSLNPTMRVGEQIEEVFIGTGTPKAEVRLKALNIMRLVGINDPERRFMQYPHELSGGMKQRIMIAIALVSRPSLIICDEPTTSLDVTIEAQILDLLLELRMYGGKVAEQGTSEDIFFDTAHPYTSGLLKSIARLDMERDQVLTPIEGTPPDLFAPPKGCPFAARCEYAMSVCYEYEPSKTTLTEEHSTYCWLQHDLAPEVNLIVEKREA